MEHVDTAAQFIISVLFNGMWEVPLFALAAWFVLRFRPRLNATTRHSLFAAVLVASVILPIVTATVAREAGSGPSSSPIDTKLGPNIAADRHRKADSSVRALTRYAATPVATTLPLLSLPHANVSLPRTVVLAIVATWLAGAAIILSRLIVSLMHLERLKSDALPLAVEYRAQLPRWSAATRGARSVRICRSSETAVPIAVGLGDAMILVPEHFLTQFEPHEIDAIVLHELAHLRRGDDWINVIERVAAALLFFNPGIRWLVGQLDLEREVACDDWVLQSSAALPYATCLSKVAETTSWPYRAMTTPGAFVTRRGMSIRIERLLTKQRDVGVHTAIGPAGATLAVLAVFGIAAISASPSIAYTAALEPARSVLEPSAVVARKPERAPPRKVAPTVSAVVVKPAPAVPAVVVKTAPIVPKPPAVQRETSLVPRLRHRSSVSAAVAARTKTFALVAGPQSVSVAADAAGNATVVAAANAPAYADELAAAGYENLSFDELIQMRAVGVTAAFIRGLQREGVSHPRIRELVEMRALGVDAAFVRAIRRRYGSSLSIDDVAGMKAVGVSAEYIDGLSAAGQPNLTAGEARNLRALDVTPAFIRDLSRAGYPNLTLDEIEQVKALGIDAAYIARAAAHGFHNLSIEQLVQLKATGAL